MSDPNRRGHVAAGLARLSPRRLTAWSALLLSIVGLLIVVIGSIATTCGSSLGGVVGAVLAVVGTGIMVVGALAGVYGIVLAMVHGFALIASTGLVLVSLIDVYRRVRGRAPPSDGEPGDDD